LKEDQAMPNRATWEPSWRIGHDTLDNQHQSLLAQCNLLADLCEAGDGENAGEAGEREFDAAFTQLKTLARQHFETGAALLAGDPERLEDYRTECDEFDYLVGEIVTAHNFSRLELQRFLTLWCVGHVAGSVASWQAWLESGHPAA
jgi:hemerythrin